MFESGLNRAVKDRRRGGAWVAFAASALGHAGLLAWFCLRTSTALGPERAISVVFFELPPRSEPEPAPSPRQREAERVRQAYLDRLVQPVEAAGSHQEQVNAPRPSSAAGSVSEQSAPDAAHASQGEDDNAPVEAGGNITRPILVSRVQPDYTRAALIAGLEGDVVLKAVIDEKGRVTHLQVLRGLAFGLDDAAVDAVRRWKFKPSTRKGKPVKVFYILTVHFRL